MQESCNIPKIYNRQYGNTQNFGNSDTISQFISHSKRFVS